MLVTFSSPAYADITMFGDIAIHLLKLMGHSGTVPGALAAEDIPAALEHLQAAIKADGRSPEGEKAADEEDGEPNVSISQRAWPLLELLRSAAKANSYVIWDKNN